MLPHELSDIASVSNIVSWNSNSNCNFIIISTNCGLVAAKRHFTSINYDVIFSFDADRKLPTLCQQQNTFTLLLSVTIDATTTLLMSFGLGSFKFLDQNLTSGPELTVIQKERKGRAVEAIEVKGQSMLNFEDATLKFHNHFWMFGCQPQKSKTDLCMTNGSLVLKSFLVPQRLKDQFCT